MDYDFTTQKNRREMASLKWYYADHWNPNLTEDVVPLSTADMEFLTAPEVTEGLKDYLNEAILGYTIPSSTYFESIINWMSCHHDWEIEKEWIVIVPGVVTAIHLAIEVFTEPGDGVIIFRPVYHQFGMAIESSQRKEVNVPLLEKGEGHYEIDFESFEKEAAKAENKMLILCSPHNPVGRVWRKEELEKIDEIARQYGLIVVADEIWHDLALDGYKHLPYPKASQQAGENVLVCTSVSKTFSLAGINTSNIIIPNKELRQAFQEVVSHGHYAANAFGYKATELAYNKAEAWLEAVKKVIKENFEYLVAYFDEHLPQVKSYIPESSYVAWVDFRELGLSAEELKELTYQDAQFMCNQGTTFGQEGTGFERVNLALPKTSLAVQLDRLIQTIEDKVG